MISWLGNFEESPSNPKRYDAYHNTVDGCSYIYDGASWTLLASKGDKGDAGTNGRSIVWKGTFHTHPENPQELWTYYNATDGNAYIYSDGSWSLLIGNLSSPSITGTIVENGNLYAVSSVYIKVVDESSNNTVWNSLPAADGDFAVSGLDASKTYTLHFSSKRLSDVNITNSKALTATTEDVSFGAVRTNVSPLSGKARDLGSIVLSPNGTVHGSVVLGGSGTGEGVDVFLDGSPYATRTDSNGEYVIKDVLQGSYSIVFRKDGYITQSRDMVVFSSNPSEAPSLEVPSVSLVMGSCTLKGTVGYEDRTDMSGVNVVLIGSNGDVCRTSMTEKDGSFSFEGVSPDTYTIRAGADGYTTVDRRISISMGESYVVPMGSLVNLCGSITGTVTTNDSGLKSGVKVKASASNGGRSYETTTDETGHYTLSNVLHGDYVLSLEKDGYETYTINVTVEPGKTSTSDAHLKSRFGSIRVIVSFVDKDDPTGIVVNVYRNGTLIFSSTTTSTGIIVIANLPIGDGYSVMASSDGYGSSGEDKVTVSSGTVSEVNLQKLSNRYGSIKGRVVDAGGNPIESATVGISSGDGNSYTLTTSKDGTFSKTDVAVGTYTVSAGKADYLTTTLERTYTVEPSLVTEIKDDIALTSRYADIAGKVSYADKEDSSNISVTVEDDKGRTLGTVVTGSTGSYSFKVESGTYYIRANAQGYFESSKVVNVVSGNGYAVELEDIRSMYGSIKGRVVDAGGSPIGAASVNISSDDGNSYTLTTANDGTFCKTDVAIGTYSISVSKVDYLVATLPMAYTIESSQVTEIKDDIVLVSKYAEVRGKASYIGKNDASNISVTVEDSEGRILGTVVTGSTGAYSFKVESGTYRLRANSQGCFESYRVFTVAAGNSYDIDVNGLALMYGSVSGKVQDQNGVAIEGATIRLVSVDGSSIYTCTSGSDGSFSNKQVLVGDYSVHVGKTGFQTVALPLEYGIESSMDTSIGVVALTSEYAEINGSVGYSDRSDSSGILVTIEDSSGKTIDSFTVGNDGTFSFRVSSGTFLIRANAFGYSEKTKTITVVSGNDYVVDIENVESMFGSIKGRVADVNGEPLESATVNILSVDGDSYTITTTKDGTFYKTDIVVGIYTVSVSKADYLTKTLSQSFSIESSKETLIGVVSLTNKYAYISGSVGYSNRSDPSGIFVTIEDSSGRTIDSFTVGSDGTFSFRVLAGTFTITANADSYAEASKTITVVAEKAYSIDLGRVNTLYGLITGKVVDAAGNAVSGAVVNLTNMDGTGDAVTLSTNENGEFSSSTVPIGTYTVSITKDGYIDVVCNDVPIVGGRTYDVGTKTFVSGTAGITGRVVLEGASNYSGVTVSATSLTDSSKLYTTTTTEDGLYYFVSLDVGTWLLKFQKDGYLSVGPEQVPLASDTIEEVKVVTLKNENSVVKGTVSLDGSSSFLGVNVLLKNSSDGMTFSTTTDIEGRYVISNVKPGSYELVFSKEGYSSATVKDLYVDKGTTKVVDGISLDIAVTSIKGQVSLELRTDFSGALVTATSISNPDVIYSAITNSQGTFTFAKMYSGEYQIVVSCNGYSSITLPTVRVADDKPMDIGSVSLDIERGTVAGIARLEGYSNHSGVKVTILGTDYETTTSEDGSYSFSIPAGNYPGGLRFESEDFETTSYASTISVLTNSTYAIPDMELKCLRTSIHGKVDVLTTDNESDVTISFDGDPSIDPFVTTSTGEFLFEHVPLGDYVMRFKREDCSDITVPVKVVASDGIELSTITLTPNTATITGKVTLKDALSSDGVRVSVDMGDGKILETFTDMSGRYELGGVSIADAYTIQYSKEGWNGTSQAMASKLDALERRELPEVVMTDTTAPVLKSITINNGSNTTADKNVVIHVDADDLGSGCKTIIVSDFNSSGNIAYANAVDWTLEGINGEKTVYVKVLDRAGNESNTLVATITLADQKTEVKGVLKGDNLAWTKERSPYLVTGNLLVEKDDVLKIEPGVDVQFEGDFYLQVEGKLESKGTEDERISFYGIGAGEDNWYGMKFVNDNTSLISYATVSGLKNGISGYCNIDHADITAKGWAVGNSSTPEYDGTICFLGRISNSRICGNVSMKNGFITSNKINGNEIHLYSTNVDGNTFEGTSLTTHYCFVYNNDVSTSNVTSVQDIQRYVAYNNCNLQIGFDTNYSCDMKASALSQIQFNNCTFSKLAASVNNSNFVNCGPITITTDRKKWSEFDLTGNHWGELNTVELDSKGDGSNMGFINDYYDDFNLSKVLYSDWKGSAVVDAGYQGEGFGRDELTTTAYSIGDAGPAGGLVFYDKGFYSDGWRYLEAAPSDIGSFAFGYYRPDKENNVVGTSLAVGSGMYNTERLVKYMDIEGKAYSDSSGEDVKEYAARECLDYEHGGYDDWYLPSNEELNLMYENLCKKGLGSFAHDSYWSSSEDVAIYAWLQHFSGGFQSSYIRGNAYCVRPIRAF